MIFIDLDDTLWKSASLEEAWQFIESEEAQWHYDNLDPEQQEEYLETYGRDVVVFDLFGRPTANGLHPQARMFLRSCRRLAPTAILTYGTHDVQDEIWQLHGLNALGIPLYANEDLDNLPQDSNSILVDNRPPQYPHCAHKLRSLGINHSRLIPVRDYDGSRTDKSLLDHTLPQVISFFR